MSDASWGRASAAWDAMLRAGPPDEGRPFRNTFEKLRRLEHRRGVFHRSRDRCATCDARRAQAEVEAYTVEGARNG